MYIVRNYLNAPVPANKYALMQDLFMRGWARLRCVAATLQGARWRRLACLAALFAVVYGARLWLVDDFGSPVPFWDEWDAEGGQLFKPFLLGQLHLSSLFDGHNEHRIVLTRLLELGLFRADGMWDPRLEMVVNATIAAGTATLIAYLLILEMGGEWWRPVIGTVAVLWILPYARENTLWGFQSQFYFLVLFSFVALWGLSHGPAFTGRWWLGTASLVLAGVSFGSGLLAGLAVVAIRCLAIALDRSTWRTHWLTLLAGLLGAGILLGFAPHAPKNEEFHAQGPWYFLVAFFKYLSWPACKQGVPVFIFMVPVLVCARTLVREKGRQPARWFILSLAIWTAMQAAALAYGRGGRGGSPASRYQDILVIGFLAASMALLFEWPRINRWLRYGWLFLAIFGLVQGTSHDFRNTFPQARQHLVEQLRRCRGYIESRDPAILRNVSDQMDLPYPKADKLAGYLDDPQLRSIFIFMPGQEERAGWPTQISKGLLKGS
jgi:hypothetical protein